MKEISITSLLNGSDNVKKGFLLLYPKLLIHAMNSSLYSIHINEFKKPMFSVYLSDLM